MQHMPWDHALTVTDGGSGLVGHAGAILLRKAADQAGLTAWLSAALQKAGQSPVFGRGGVLVSLAAAIALGATSMSDIAVLAQLSPVLGAAPSGPTVRRALDLAGMAVSLERIARARAKARVHVWELIESTAAGFPWLVIAGKTLTGWLVIDLDATLITAHSDKEGAAPTWKKGYGFHPLGAWLANTRECLAMLLRPGNAGSNTFADHKEVLAAAIRQVPARFRKQVLVRVDGAGASHELIRHLRVDDHRRGRGRDPAGPRGRVGARHRPRRQPRGGQGRRGDHAPAQPGRELAGRAAVDHPPGQAVPPAPEEPHRLREEDRLEILDYLHEHPRHRDRRRSRQPPPPVHRRGPPRARRRGDRRRPHRQGHGPAEPAIENLAGQQRLGHRREHRRRPDRLDPPSRPLRQRGPKRSRPGHTPLPDLAHPRPPRPPRPAACLEDQPGLAVEGSVPHLLAAPANPARTHLTSTISPCVTKGAASRRGRSRCQPGHTGQHHAPIREIQTDTRPQTGHKHNQ